MRKLYQKKRKSLTKNRGFTLVELLVAISIFLLAITVVFQLFFSSLRIERRLVAHSQLVNEMSYNLEHVSRGIRMAKKSLPTDPSCLSSLGMNFEKTATGIRFQNPKLDGGVECVHYYIGHPADYPAGKRALMESRASAAWSFDLPLTSPEVDIINFSIYDKEVNGWSQGDTLQPRVTLYIEAKNDSGEIMKDQITVSQRDLDINE